MKVELCAMQKQKSDTEKETGSALDSLTWICL